MKKLLLLSALSLFIFASCTTEEIHQESQFSLETLKVLAQLDPLAFNGKGGVTRMQPPIYGGDECIIYSGIVAPAQFKPESDPFDELYMIPGGFAFSVSLISDARPGDQNYNGGRWHVNVLKEGVTTDYSMACKVEDLDLNDFMSAGAYFACPMRPIKD